MSATEIRVYDRTGANLVQVIPQRRNVKVKRERNLPGIASFDVRPAHAKARAALASLPNAKELLKHRAIVKVATDLDDGAGFVERDAWFIERRKTVVVDTGEHAGRWCQVSGRSLLGLLEKIPVYPRVALGRFSKDDRWFGFMSEVGPWYLSADWTAPFYRAFGTFTNPPVPGLPHAWPNTTSQAMWTADPNSTGADGTYREALFRGSFTLPGLTVVKFSITADDFYDLYVNGDLVSFQNDKLFQWKNTFPEELTLPAGTHEIALKSSDSIGPVSWVMCAVESVDAAGNSTGTLFETVPGSNWVCHQVQPGNSYVGWRPDHVLRKLALEAQARGNTILSSVTIDFTDTVDSAGVPWSLPRLDRSFKIGENMLSVVQQLAELGLDVEITPDMKLKAWQSRGADLTATVAFLPGKNLVEHIVESTCPQTNRFLSLTLEGWKETADAASEAANGSLVGFLSVGNTAATQQVDLVTAAAFAELAYERVDITSRAESTPGARFGLEVNVADRVTTVDELEEPIGVRCVALAFEETDDGRLVWTPSWTVAE